MRAVSSGNVDPRPLDYYTTPQAVGARPVRMIAHSCASAALCLVALFVDFKLRYDALEAGRVAVLETILAAYGFVAATACLASFGRLRFVDRVVLVVCLGVFAVTTYVGLMMPRVIHY